MKVKNLHTGKIHKGIYYVQQGDFEEITILPDWSQLFNHKEQQEFEIIKP